MRRTARIAQPAERFDARLGSAKPEASAWILRDRLLFGPASGYVHDTFEQIERYQPDAVVIMDLTMGAMLASEHARVPTAVIAPNILIYPVPGRPPAGPGLLPARSIFGRLRDRVVFRISLRELGAEEMAQAIGRAVGRSVRAVPTPAWLFMKTARPERLPYRFVQQYSLLHRGPQTRRIRAGRTNH